MKYPLGSLVKTRDREWVVLPDSNDTVLHVKPLGGTDAETTWVLPSLETVESAQFAPPNPEHLGDLRAARLLRDAVRLGVRASTGPFRSLASVAVEPRSYQLVPLLMALRQNVVRLLIADDVGIGKTIEASLIAKELLERGEISSLAVLCPPHLVPQWETELSTKFGLDAKPVLPSTVRALEKECLPGENIFQTYPVTIVSLDYVKQPARRDDFLRTCPQFVIVDEAHTCTDTGQGSHQMRHRLIERLADDPQRHLLLVTATPHSGKEDAFRSLLGLLSKEFLTLPSDMGGDANRALRQRLSQYFVQRRRADIVRYLSEDTKFPERVVVDEQYYLHPDYKAFFDKAIEFAREVISDKSGTVFQQRIRWYSMVSLLRSIGSSPPAALATLKARAAGQDTDNDPAAVDRLGGTLYDTSGEDEGDINDTVQGADYEPDDARSRQKLLELQRMAEALHGTADNKMKRLTVVVKDLLNEGYNPIVFCRFIPTAEYVAENLANALPKSTTVVCVTGNLAHDERVERVQELESQPSRVLVCTDCLSEGINLQESFDAVVHADLGWSPTRHEQREGRVDRFGQPSPKIKIVNYYGNQNPIDGVVWRVVLQKFAAIRNQLGYSVPIPVDTHQVCEAILEGEFLRGSPQSSQLSLDLIHQTELQYESVVQREKRSRTIFAQASIKPEEVRSELEAMQERLGRATDVERFVKDAVEAYGGQTMPGRQTKTLHVELKSVSRPLREALGDRDSVDIAFHYPPPGKAISVNRVHPMIEDLASFVLEDALDGNERSGAKRCGLVVTDAVTERTVLLIVRNRFRIHGTKGELLAEDVQSLAFTGSPESPQWLDAESAEALLDCKPVANRPPDVARRHIRGLMERISGLDADLKRKANDRAEAALVSHQRVRAAATGIPAPRKIDVQGDPDILGLFLFSPGSN